MNRGREILNRIDEDVEKLADLYLRFPVLKDYIDREKYYEADKLVRTEVGNKLNESKLLLSTQLQKLSKDITNSDKIETFSNLTNGLEKLINRINTAEYGYSGYFAKIKVKLADLDRLLIFDGDFIDTADSLKTELESLIKSGSVEEFSSISDNLQNNINMIDEKINERKLILMEVKNGTY